MQRHRNLRRVRTGCNPCKQRKKKCDEGKPCCLGCTRNHLICSWPDPTKKEKPRRRKTSTPSGRQDDPVTVLEPHVSEPVPAPTQGNHQQKISPMFSCYQLSTLQPAARRLLRNTSSFSLFDHFIACTVPNLAIRRGVDNPWQTLVLPYAESHEMLLHAILALSSAHIKTKVPETSVHGYDHYGLAMRGLKYGLTRYASENGSLLPLVMTALCLALFEGIGGSTKGAALRHLTGAGNLLKLWLTNSRHVHEMDGFLIETYFYFATMSSLSIDNAKAHEIFVETASLLNNTRFVDSAEFGHLCGDTHRLFLCIPRIGALACGRQITDQDSSSEDLTLRREWLDIHKAIDEWQSSDAISASLATCAEIYRRALFLYLAMSCPSEDLHKYNSEEVLQDYFQEALSYLDHLDVEDPASSIIPFPLAVLGCYTTDPNSRVKIRNRLLQQYELDGMNTFKVVADLLENFWSQGTDAGGFSTIHTFRTLSRSILIG